MAETPISKLLSRPSTAGRQRRPTRSCPRPAPADARGDRERHPHHRRQAHRSPRARTCSRRATSRHQHLVLLLPPRAVVAGGVPPVPGRGQGPAQAGAVLLHAGRRQDGRDHRVADACSTARAQMLEFTLVNHPIDCPICDKAGECTLQKHVLRLGRAVRAQRRHKVHKAKVVDLGPAHRARPRALHPVHALHPRLRRGRQGAPARDGEPRRPRGADHRARASGSTTPTRSTPSTSARSAR